MFCQSVTKPDTSCKTQKDLTAIKGANTFWKFLLSLCLNEIYTLQHKKKKNYSFRVTFHFKYFPQIPLKPWST